MTADIAFLTMELSFAGHHNLAEIFADTYFAKTIDSTGKAVLPSVRVVSFGVRAKVAAILGDETEVPKSDREKGGCSIARALVVVSF